MKINNLSNYLGNGVIEECKKENPDYRIIDELLIPHGANIDFVNDKGEDIENVAVNSGNKLLLTRILNACIYSKKDNICGKSIICTAAENNCIDSVKEFYKYVNSYTKLDETKALLIASKNNNEEIVKLINEKN